MLPVAVTEQVSLAKAAGRVIAEDIAAPFSVPPFDTSAMDGFAVKSDDLSDELKLAGGVTLEVTDEVAAGFVSAKKVAPGTAIKIMTGAPLPEGADAILMKELAEETKDGGGWKVATKTKVAKGLHVRRVGADFTKGAVVIKCGTYLNPPALGIIASAARAEVKVYKKPEVAVLSTGDELIDPHDREVTRKDFAPGPGKIMNSNLYLLVGLLRDAGAAPRPLGIAKDTPEAIAEKISTGLKAADIVITTGGASVGSYDFIPEALKLLGLEVSIWKMDIKPGRPFIFGLKKGPSAHFNKFVFGLPGNPASSMVSFIKLIRPAVYKLCGRAEPLAATIVAGELNGEVRQDGERTTYLRTRIAFEGGRAVVEAPKKQDSNILSSALAANCLAVIPPGDSVLAAGTVVAAEII